MGNYMWFMAHFINTYHLNNLNFSVMVFSFLISLFLYSSLTKISIKNKQKLRKIIIMRIKIVSEAKANVTYHPSG